MLVNKNSAHVPKKAQLNVENPLEEFGNSQMLPQYFLLLVYNMIEDVQLRYDQHQNSILKSY